MIHSNQPVIKITNLNQVCMVVNDLEKSMASLWSTFGIGPWDISVRDYGSEIEAESILEVVWRDPAKIRPAPAWVFPEQ